MRAARGIAKITLSPLRLEALTDAVFAIVMTLLVLELSVPVIAEGSAHTELWPRLIDMWPIDAHRTRILRAYELLRARPPRSRHSPPNETAGAERPERL